MHPVLFSIKGITIYTYGLFVSVGFLVGFILFLMEVKRRGFVVDTGIDLAFWVLLSAVVFSRLAYVLVNFSYFSKYPLRIFMIWEGGLVWYGAFIGALISAVIYFKAKKLEGWLWADMCAPSVALGQALGRIGCLMAGCCYGKPTDLPWGIVFERSDIAPLGISLHPTQVYHMIFNFLIFVFLFYRRKKVKFRGELILSYVLLYAGARSIVEVFRGDPRGYCFGDMISTSGFISIIAVAVSIVLYYKIKDKNRILDKKIKGERVKKK